MNVIPCMVLFTTLEPEHGVIYARYKYITIHYIPGNINKTFTVIHAAESSIAPQQTNQHLGIWCQAQSYF